MASKHTRADRGAATPRTVRSHQELEFRALLDAAVDAIIVVDHHGKEPKTQGANEMTEEEKREVRNERRRGRCCGQKIYANTTRLGVCPVCGQWFRWGHAWGKETWVRDSILNRRK